MTSASAAASLIAPGAPLRPAANVLAVTARPGQEPAHWAGCCTPSASPARPAGGPTATLT